MILMLKKSAQFENQIVVSHFEAMSIWQGVAMDSLNFHPGLPCPTLLRPVDGPPLKWPYGCFRCGPPAGQATCGPSSTPMDTPHRTPMFEARFPDGPTLRIVLTFVTKAFYS
jgi:hypothetical protein